MRGFLVVTILLSLAATALSAPCPRPCKEAIRALHQACKETCAPRKPGKPCRKACRDERRVRRQACSASTDPTPPLCGSPPPTTTSSTTTTTPTTSTTSTTLCEPQTCRPPDQCHEASCDAGTNTCVVTAKPNATPCDDGNLCTTVDTCRNGVCTGEAPVVCIFPNACQEPGACNPETGQCAYPPKPDGTPCSDGNRCSVGDECQGGQCVSGPPVVCPPIIFPIQCRQFVQDCNPATGQCMPRFALDGTECDDQNACTSGDHCEAGECVGSLCEPPFACCAVDQPCVDLRFDSANCGACGNVCVNSVCLFGQCYDGCVINGVGYPNGTRNPGNDCEVCDTSKSRTTWTRLGTLRDFVGCRAGCLSGVCSLGVCQITSPLPLGSQCPDPSGCSVGTCNANGDCVFTPVNEGGACIPNLSTNPCKSSTTGTCRNGHCVPDSANEGGFCDQPIPYPFPNSVRWCFSTTKGTCANGVCQPNFMPGAPCYADPFEPNLCYVGTCDAGTGGCTLPPTRCSDGSCACQVSRDCGGPEFDGTCDPATGECTYPLPFPDKVKTCGGFVEGKHPERCCPDEVCTCPPGLNGFPSFCIEYVCVDAALVP